MKRLMITEVEGRRSKIENQRSDAHGRRPRAFVAGLAFWAAAWVMTAGAALAQDQAESAPASQPPAAAGVSAASEPAASEPAATQPVATEPSATQPLATQPAATQPGGTASGMAASGLWRPVASQPAAVGTPIVLNFRDATVRSVLEYLSEAAGLVVVEDAKVDGRITIISRQPISVDEAVALLDTVLKTKGCAAVRLGRTLKIVTIDQAKKELIPVRSGADPEKITPSDRMITQIIPIKYADAVKLKADLASLIPTGVDVASNAASNTLIVTGTESIVRRLVEILRAIDVQMSEVSQVKVFQLKYANATSAARLITEIFREDQQGGQTGVPGFGGGRRGGGFMISGLMGAPGGGGGSSDEKGQRGAKVTASADDRTNTLVVSASPDVMKVIEGMVKDLDANPAEQQAVFIYHLKNATAVNLESVLNNIFGAGGAGLGGGASRAGTGGSTGTGFGTGARAGGGSSFGGNSTFGTRGGGGGTRGSGGVGGSGGLTGLGGGNTVGAQGRTGTGAQGRTTGGGFGGFNRGASPGTTAAASDLIGQVYVVADPDTNSLLVTTASKNFERVRAIIVDLDRAVPQVLIKVLIAEVTHDKSLDLGVEFSGMNLRASGKGFQAGTDFAVAAQAGGFSFKLEEQNVMAALRAIAGVAKLDVLSRPYILTGDNQAATIMVGQELPFITYSQITAEGTVNNTVQYVDVGIILQVTPHINPQGLVTLDVYPEISEPTGERVPLNPQASSPVIARRFAQSRVAIRDGQTIVIGGLMEDRNTKSVDKVPWFGDLPGIGWMFRRTVEKKTKTELLIFLTPHVAEQPDELKAMSESEQSGVKAVNTAVDKETYEDHLKGMKLGASTRPARQEEDMGPAEGAPNPDASGLRTPAPVPMPQREQPAAGQQLPGRDDRQPAVPKPVEEMPNEQP